MRWIEHNKIDRKRWDKCIQSSELPLVFAQSFYLDATSPSWSGLVWGNYEAVMPLTVKKKLGIKFLLQPPFTPCLGLYGQAGQIDPSSLEKFLRSEFRYVDIELNLNTGLKGQGKRTYVLDLSQAAAYNENTRRNIQRGLKAGLEITRHKPSESSGLYIRYLRQFMREKLSLQKKDLEVFGHLLRSAEREGTLSLFTCRNASDVKAIGFFISNGRHAVYLKGTNFDRNSGSMHLLMDHAINHYRAMNTGLFDFGGGQKETLARFYQGFGAVPMEYVRYRSSRLPFPLKYIKGKT